MRAPAPAGRTARGSRPGWAARGAAAAARTGRPAPRRAAAPRCRRWRAAAAPRTGATPETHAPPLAYTILQYLAIWCTSLALVCTNNGRYVQYLAQCQTTDPIYPACHLASKQAGRATRATQQKRCSLACSAHSRCTHACQVLQGTSTQGSSSVPRLPLVRASGDRCKGHRGRSDRVGLASVRVGHAQARQVAQDVPAIPSPSTHALPKRCSCCCGHVGSQALSCPVSPLSMRLTTSNLHPKRMC